jgi:hypothetical protein
MLRGTLGATGVAGASLVGSGLLEPAYAGFPQIRFFLDKAHYQPGEAMTLKLKEDVRRPLKVRVTDSRSTVWTKSFKNDRRQVWKATAGQTGGTGIVTILMRRSDGRVFRRAVAYSVAGGTPPPSPAAATRIGMSAPVNVWDARVSAVGGGLAARRIFADLANGYTSQIKLVEEAHATGMLPVISYKVGGNAAGAVNGEFNAVADQAAAKLASYGRPTAVSFWHEPRGDISPADYVAASKQVLPFFKRGELRVGPILNGWLLDNQVAEFESYMPDEMFGLWDWIGMDTYESGTASSPGPRKPADRVPALSSYLSSRGVNLPIGVGEYNGFTAESIAATGEALLSTPNVWFGCVWNAEGDRGWELSGDRLTAFQQTLADPRSAEPS